MKKTLIGLFVLVFLSSTALAGQSNGQANGQSKQGGGKGQRMARMQQELGLSQEQMGQMRAIRENGGGRDEMRAVLSEEQRTQMDEYRAMRQGQGRGDGSRRGQPRENTQGDLQGTTPEDNDG